jgi:hypothetical protein
MGMSFIVRTTVVVWGICVLTGLSTLAAFTYSPAMPGPDDVTHSSPNGEYRLEMYLHPECSCSGASVAQLARLAAEVRDDAMIDVWLSPEVGLASSCESAETWAQATVTDDVWRDALVCTLG